MSLSKSLRALVTARLTAAVTAAAEDIFVLFEKTIAEYEEELYQKRLRGLEDRVLMAVEQGLSRSLLSQNTAVSHSPQTRMMYRVTTTTEERAPVSTGGTEGERRAFYTGGASSVSHTSGTSGTSRTSNTSRSSGTVEEPAAPSADGTGAGADQPVLHQVFQTADELLSFTSTVCVFCVRKQAGNKNHLMQKHLKEAMYFLKDNAEQFVIACFCQEKPLEYNRSHYHCPFCDFKVFARDVTFKKHLSGIHGLTANKKSAVLMSWLCPAYSVNQELSDPPQRKEKPLEQRTVKQEEEPQPVAAPQSSVFVKTEQSSLLLQRQTEEMETEEHSSDTDNDDNWTRPISCSDGKSTGLFPKSKPAPESSEAAAARAAEAAERRKHQCQFCMKRFAFQQVLQRHVGVHLGLKPYRCSTCNTRFSEQRTRDEHAKTHAREKPFSCSACQETFVLRSRLAAHRKTHSKPFGCSQCEKTFTLNIHLRDHMNYHTGERPYSCSVCSRAFACRRRRKVHMKSHSRKK